MMLFESLYSFLNGVQQVHHCFCFILCCFVRGVGAESPKILKQLTWKTILISH